MSGQHPLVFNHFYCVVFVLFCFLFSSPTRISVFQFVHKCISHLLIIFFENLPMKYLYDIVTSFLVLNIPTVNLHSSVSYLVSFLFPLFPFKSHII